MTVYRNIGFNEVFREANATRRRYRVIGGSAGSGKSCNVAADYIIKLSDPRYRGANLLVVRKSESSCRSSVFAELTSAISRVFGEYADRFWCVKSEPMTLTSYTGSTVIFRGMNDRAQREKVKSITFPVGKLTWIWCEEATELAEGDLDILDDRLRGRLDGVNPELYYQLTLTFNPISARHFIKRRFYDCGEGEDIFRMMSTYRDNRFIDPEFERRMERRRESDPDGYRVYALGEWGGDGGDLIYTSWRVGELEGGASRADFVWLAQDFGFNHADCILLLGERDGHVYVLDEIYVRGRDTAEIIKIAEERGFPKNAPMYCDSAEPDRIRTWRRAGWNALGVKKGSGSVMASIEALLGQAIVISPRCESLIGELREWSWLRDPVSGELTDVPRPGNDDAIAALRYAMQPFSERREMRSIPKGMLGL